MTSTRSTARLSVQFFEQSGYKRPDLAFADGILAVCFINLFATTLGFVESHYPREVLTHLREERGYAVEEKRSGIYIIKGDILPIQIIDNRKLSEEENIWLKDLDNRLDVPLESQGTKSKADG